MTSLFLEAMDKKNKKVKGYKAYFNIGGQIKETAEYSQNILKMVIEEILEKNKIAKFIETKQVK